MRLASVEKEGEPRKIGKKNTHANTKGTYA